MKRLMLFLTPLLVLSPYAPVGAQKASAERTMLTEAAA